MQSPKPAEQLRSAIVFTAEMRNGETSTVTTIFNNSTVHFEELVRFIRLALATNKTAIKKIRTDFGTIENGKFKIGGSYPTLEL